MSSFSSSCLSSCRDRRCVLPGPGYRGEPPVPPGPLVLVQVAGQSPVGDTDRKVGVPSIVFTMGLRRPPRSNSCAEILRTGVVAPDPVLDGGAVLAGSAEPEVSAGLTWWLGDERSAAGGTMQLLLLADVGVAWETSHVSTTCRVAFLPARRDNLMTNGSDGDRCAHYDKKTSNADRGNSLTLDSPDGAAGTAAGRYGILSPVAAGYFIFSKTTLLAVQRVPALFPGGKAAEA